jgi:hypothetical protein
MNTERAEPDENPRKNLISTLFALLVLPICLTVARAQAPGILAEGVYGANTQSPMPTVPGVHWVHGLHWTMTGVPGGGFKVEEARIVSGNDNRFVQVFGFSKEWKPASFSLQMFSRDSAQPSMSLVCEYQQDAISCDGLDHEKTTSDSLHVDGPKVFLPPGFATDMFWVMAAVCTQAERTPGKVTDVAVVSVVDDPKSSVLKLEVAESLPVAYIGQEDLKTALGTMRAHKFRIQDMPVWTADSGLVLAMTFESSDGGTRIDLSSLEDKTHSLVPAAVPK